MVRIVLVVLASLGAASGFTTLPTSRNDASRSMVHSPSAGNGPLHMVAASSENFGDDMVDRIPKRRPSGKGKGDGKSSNIGSSGSIQQQEEWKPTKFVAGDDLHRLRHEVLAMRLELQEARRSASAERVKELERAVMKAQQVDAEFVYTVSLERMELAQQEGRFQDAEKYRMSAYEARSSLPQFNLEGLWVGKYGDHGYEMINVTYNGDTLLAKKVTGTKNVPKGQVTFEVDLSPKSFATATRNRQDNNDGSGLLEPIELGDNAARQWGCKYLQRFAGRGQVAAEGYLDSQWIEGQLIMVNEYFSFAWLPIGHQVFFGRPTPELILKLMKDDQRKETGDCTSRAFLEKCWEETEHMEDDHEVSFQATSDSPSCEQDYHQQGCFE